ncbi:MAG: hypothetical protein V3S17_02670, partial [candidate division Zixibacteria bacterium]
MTRTLIVFMILLLLFAAGAQAQDPGIADTVELVVTLSPDAEANQLKLQLELWVFNDEELTAANMGFSWDNQNLTLDSAIASALTDDGFGIGPFFYEDNSIAITNANQRFLFGGIAIFPLFPADSSTRRLWGSYYFTLSNWNPEDSVVIDTLTFSDGTTYKFVTIGNASYPAFWPGLEIAHDTSYNPPSNLVLELDSLHFDAVEGESGPPGQAFWIYSDESPLDFTLVE